MTFYWRIKAYVAVPEHVGQPCHPYGAVPLYRGTVAHCAEHATHSLGRGPNTPRVIETPTVSQSVRQITVEGEDV